MVGYVGGSASSVLAMELLPAALSVLAVLGLGSITAAGITSRTANKKQTWENLNRLEDRMDSDDPDVARLAFNHMSDFVDHKLLDRKQRIFARTALREYLRRTS